MPEYIERDEAIKTAITVCSPLTQFDAVDIAEAMENIPTADVVEVRHGEWKIESDPINDPKGYFIRIVCSGCGLKTGQKSNYCPNCGAKMDGKGVDNA